MILFLFCLLVNGKIKLPMGGNAGWRIPSSSVGSSSGGSGSVFGPGENSEESEESDTGV